MSDGSRPTVIWIAACPSCGLDVPWHSRQFEPATPHCPLATCNTAVADLHPIKKEPS